MVKSINDEENFTTTKVTEQFLHCHYSFKHVLEDLKLGEKETVK